MMLLINGAIALLAELGMHLCALIAIWMVDSKLGLITLGLYTTKSIAEYLIRKEYRGQMDNLFKKGDKL